MREQRAQKINEAAQRFIEALAASYEEFSGPHPVSARRLNAELTMDFFDAVIDNLRVLAGSDQDLIRELAGQQRQRDTVRALMQESVGAHMDFLEFVFSYYRREVEAGEETRGE